jgi:hypothetical protein
MAGRSRFAKRKPTKREREKRLQGWFDPENPSHKYVIDMAAYFRDQGISEGQFIERAVYALGELGGYIPMPIDKNVIEVRLSQMQEQIQQMNFLLEQAQLAPRIQEFHSAMPVLQEELSSVEEGVAIGYASFTIEDEDE